MIRRKRTEEEKRIRYEKYQNRSKEEKQKDIEIARRNYYKHNEIHRKRSQDYRDKNTVNGISHEKQYCIDHPEKYLWWAARNRAKKNGTEFTIKETDIIIPEYCPVLQIKLVSVRQTRQNRDFVPSVDRLDNTKGYIPGNIEVISFKANRYKTDMSFEDIERLYEYVKKGMKT